MYHMAGICLFWAQTSLLVSHRLWLPCPISKTLWTLGIPVQFLVLRVFLHFWVVPCVVGMQFWVSTSQNPVIGLSKLPFKDSFAIGLACGCWLPPAAKISGKGNTGLHSDTMRYDREYVACDIGEIRVQWVCFLLLMPPVCYVQYSKWTSNLHLVGVVIIEIWIDLPHFFSALGGKLK